MSRRTLVYLVAAVFVTSASADAQSARATPKNPRPTEVVTDHLKVRYTNKVVASPEGVVSLLVDIEPRPGMHVYAPGADNYQIVTMTMTDPAGLETRPLKYPPSEMYFFAPLNEKIPVYQKPFQLIMEAIVANDSKKTLKGQLEYQACDDKVCFAPVEVPMSWTVSR